MRFVKFLTLALSLGTATVVGAVGCSDDPEGNPIPNPSPNADGGLNEDGSAPPTGVVAKGPSRGSAIALADDDSVLLVCNRDSGSVTGDWLGPDIEDRP
jgi:hypothetical protein